MSVFCSQASLFRQLQSSSIKMKRRKNRTEQIFGNININFSTKPPIVLSQLFEHFAVVANE